MFPCSTIFTLVFTLCSFRHLSSLGLYKVRLQDEAPGVTVKGEFILLEYSSDLEKWRLNLRYPI